jgi:hypothetical protein
VLDLRRLRQQNHDGPLEGVVGIGRTQRDALGDPAKRALVALEQRNGGAGAVGCD